MSSRATRRRGPAALLPLIALPLAFDFKGEGGGLWQYLITAVTFVAAAAYLLDSPSMPAKTRLWRLSLLALLAPVGGGVLTWLAYGIPFDRFIRVAIPSWLLLVGLLVGARACLNAEAQRMTTMVYWGCLISTVFSVFTGFLLSGASASEIRFQILSPVLLCFEAVLLHMIFVRQSYKRTHIVLLVTCLALQFLSVTRSSLIGTFILFVVATWLGAANFNRFIQKTLASAAIAILIGFLVAQGTAMVNPNIAERWENRLGTSQEIGFDPTTLSRVAELKEQIHLWQEDTSSILFGRGYGASFGWSEEFFDELLQSGQFDMDILGAQYFEAGHNFWISSLFGGGIIFGLWQPLLIGVLALHSIRTTKRSHRNRWTKTADAECGRLSALLICAFVVTTIGGNPMGPRYTPLITGFAIGMFLVQDYRRRLVGKFPSLQDNCERSAAEPRPILGPRVAP